MSPSTKQEPTTAWNRPLLEWFRANARSLPWRDRSADAYAVWISEIMLQQTTVAAVIPYFERWMSAFPTVQALARADGDEILCHWAGLGYYARARNIRRAAQIVVRDHGGRLPADLAQLRALPGIGRYTAGAIASIAYGIDAPVVDGNVARVVSRLYGIDADIDASATVRDLWRIVEGAIPPGEAGDFNQALMELGATICLPASPRCAECPVGAFCVARASGDPTALPVRSRRTQWTSVVDCAALIEVDRRIFLLRRPDRGVWGGLWELPRATLQEGEEPDECARRACRERAGINARIGSQFGRIRHTVMNRRITLIGYEARAENCESVETGDDAAWVGVDDLATLALSSPQRALIDVWAASLTAF